MKNSICKVFVIALFFILSLETNAQRVEFSALIGHTYGSNFNIAGGRARLGEGTTFGNVLGFEFSKNQIFEFQYTRQITNVYATSIFLKEDVSEPATVNYFLFGGSQFFDTHNPGFKPFFSIKVGWGTINPRNISFPSLTKFTGNMSTGFKYALNQTLDLRTSFNLTCPIISNGVNLWWSPGGGTAVGVSGRVALVQFNMLIGIGIKI